MRRLLARPGLIGCAVAWLLLGCQPFYRDDELRALRAQDARTETRALARARQALAQGKAARAAHDLTAVIERNPAADAATYLLLAQAQRASDQPAAARASAQLALSRAVPGQVEEAEARSLLIESYAQAGLTPRALDWLQPQTLRSAGKIPVLDPSLRPLIEAEQLADSQPDQALARYAQWLSTYGEPDHPLLRAARQRILQRVAARTAGIAEVGQRLLSGGDAVAASRYLALAYRYQTDAGFLAYAAAFQRACAATPHPESSSPLATSEAQRGDQALAQDRLGPALHSYRLAVASCPCWWLARRNLALLLAQLGQTHEAQRQLDWARQLQPNLRDAQPRLPASWSLAASPSLTQARAAAKAQVPHQQSTTRMRDAGLMLVSLAGISGGLAGLFVGLSSDLNRPPQPGDLTSPTELESLHRSGQTYSAVALGAAITGGALLVAGVPLLLVGQRRPAVSAALLPSPLESDARRSP